LCRGNAHKEIPDIISANLYLIDAGLCHPVDSWIEKTRLAF